MICTEIRFENREKPGLRSRLFWPDFSFRLVLSNGLLNILQETTKILRFSLKEKFIFRQHTVQHYLTDIIDNRVQQFMLLIGQ
jgi:hypothetical protein